jgi:hypothetical protein
MTDNLLSLLKDTAALVDRYIVFLEGQKPVDLKIVATQEKSMSLYHVKMGPKGRGKGAAGTPIQLTNLDPVSIFLDPVDSKGNDLPVTPDMIGTLADDQSPTGVVAGTDTLHYTETIPAGTPASTQITLMGGMTSSLTPPGFAPLGATQVLITPTSPAVLPADLIIKVTLGN